MSKKNVPPLSDQLVRIVNKFPALRKHKASGLGRIILRFVVPKSAEYPRGILTKTIYLGKYGTIECNEYYAYLHRLFAEKALGPDVTTEQLRESFERSRDAKTGHNLTLATACKTYMDQAVFPEHGEKSSEASRHRMLTECLVAQYGNERAAAFGPFELEEVRRAMVSRVGKNGKPWSRGYVNGQVSRVKAMYRWLANKKLVPVAAWNDLLTVKGLHKRGQLGARETKKIRPVSDAAVEATLPHLPEIVADIVRVQRLTGMRPGEVCIVRPCDIERTGPVWLYRPRQHKTEHLDKSRVIAVGPRAQAILTKYLLRDAEAYCFSPRESEAKRRVPRGRGKSEKVLADYYSVGTYRRAISRACDKAFPAPEGCDTAARKVWRSDHRWHPNQLRHAAGTEIRREYGLEAAQVILGHSNANVTQVYAERDLAKAIDVARKLG